MEFGESILDEIKTSGFHYITGQVVPEAYTIRKKACWYPTFRVYGTWNLKLPALLEVGACVRWPETIGCQ